MPRLCTPIWGSCGAGNRSTPALGKRRMDWFGGNCPLLERGGKQPPVAGSQPGEEGVWADGSCPSECHPGHIPAGDGVCLLPSPSRARSPSRVVGAGLGWSPEAPLPRVTAGQSRSCFGLSLWPLGWALLVASATRRDGSSHLLRQAADALSRLSQSPFNLMKRQDGAPGWERAIAAPTPRGRRCLGLSRLPAVVNRDPNGVQGHCPSCRCYLPQTLTLLFCEGPEIFMALRRAPRNESFIKRVPGAKISSPRPRLKLPSSDLGAVRSTPGGWRSQALLRGSSIGNEDPGESQLSLRGGFPATRPRIWGARHVDSVRERLEETAQTLAKPRLDGTGGGRRRQSILVPSRPAGRMYSLREKCTIGDHRRTSPSRQLPRQHRTGGCR